jgi:acetyl esterase/lipase
MDPHVERILEILDQTRGQLLPALQGDPAALRNMPNRWAVDIPEGPPMAVLENRTIPGPVGDIPVRVFLPHERRGAYLHIHGGGFVLGSQEAQDWWLQRIAHEAGVAIVSVGYRLAPEHPYPAGLDDCVAAARWLMANAAGLCPEPALLGIGGESAGANLAVTTLLRLRDESGVHPFQAAALTFGWYDVGLRLPSMQLWGDRDIILSVPVMQAFADHYQAADADDPYVSPLYADLRGMPPACFVVGDLDPLLSDTEQMVERWWEAGNEAELHVYSDGFHGFTGVPTLALGRRATGAAIAFLRDKIGAGAAVPSRV